ncbi:hypothetical protein C484_07591 [Natrialba taiwanensis DSM 12281]|uniref:Uncharacterized protein n=1 Tax=Natrialba taiwanensis DSM 12281 TaxID=1230458 RepID=M0A756_9EURY|nr:hypothetical protein C484_07591 [Natrialba taiwanensis DSM 12281]
MIFVLDHMAMPPCLIVEYPVVLSEVDDNVDDFGGVYSDHVMLPAFDVATATSLWFIRNKLSIRPSVAARGTSITMTKVPSQLQTFDIAETDDVVRAYLQTECLDHPTRGPYIKSRVLYEGVEGEIDNRFSLELFGLFCESRPYLEKWSRGYNGSYRYRILREHLR